MYSIQYQTNKKETLSKSNNKYKFIYNFVLTANSYLYTYSNYCYYLMYTKFNVFSYIMI